MTGFEDGFDFEDKPEKILKEKKKTGRPKKDRPLRDNKVYTYLSNDELVNLKSKLDGIPSSIMIRKLILKFISE